MSSYVTLKRAGSNMLCSCPFHSEKTPSCTVFLAQQSFYCFGCGAGGDVITFVRKMENLGYVEALEFLAKKQESFYNKPLKELRTKDNCLIACIIRKNEVIIPNGNSSIQLGDNVIIVTTHKNFGDLADILE